MPAKQKNNYFDYNLLFIVIFLLCFGLVMLYSSSAYTSANKYGDSMYYLKLQIRNIAIGSVAMIGAMFLDYHFYKPFALLALIGSFVLCLLVYVPGIGVDSHGSSRWIAIGPIQFQPSEVAKIGVILFLSVVISKSAGKLNKLWGIVKVMLLVSPIIILVVVSNLSTGVIIFGIAFCMLFVASPKTMHFVVMAIGGIALAFFAIINVGYRSNRIEAWLSPETAGDKGYQVLMGLYAIGSGGLFGKGLGESLQKLGNLPESQNDMIFSVICEELGIFGAVCLILLFVILLWRMMIIANNAPDLYGSMLVVGVMSHIAIQAVLNIAVVTNSLPNTGIILPFVSYGGTSIIFLMGEVGVVLSVSRQIKLESISQ